MAAAIVSLELVQADLTAQDAVDHVVPPAPGPELAMPQDPLAGEAGPLERTLLGEVLDVGLGLDPPRSAGAVPRPACR